MTMQSWNLKLGNKGFIFTLDMIIAMTFTIIVLVLANYYVRTGEDVFPQIQIEQTGSDISALLDHSGVLDGLVELDIESSLANLLPINYDMHINITTKNGIRLDIGNDLPDDKSIISGKRIFVITESEVITDHAFLQYWIWLK